MVAWERDSIDMGQGWKIRGHMTMQMSVSIEMRQIMKLAMKCMAVLVRHQMIIKRLHLEDEIAILRVNLRGVEYTAVGIKSTACLVPSSTIKGVEVVTPLKIEFIVLFIIAVHLNIVVENVPGHVARIEAIAPRMESRCPEVHSERLGFVSEVDRIV